MRVLVGDIGGTHARLALVERAPTGLKTLRTRDFESASYDGLEPILREFVADLREAPDQARLAVAGPVVEGRTRLPTLGWEVAEHDLARAAGVPGLRLMNDFEALGHGLPLLEEGDVEILHEGARPPRSAGSGAVALVGAGTGLGHAYLIPEGEGHRVRPSEGGHMDFAPRTGLEWELREYLHEIYGRVSVERVVSGPGLVAIYRFLADEGRWAPESPKVREEMERKDPARTISENGLAGTDDLSVKALDMFVSAYGAHAGNLALLFRAEGGVYLAGGIAPRIKDKLQDGAFMKAFLDKGRLSGFLESIPVRVILNTRTGLLGAAAAAGAVGPAGPGPAPHIHPWGREGPGQPPSDEGFQKP